MSTLVSILTYEIGTIVFVNTLLSSLEISVDALADILASLIENTCGRNVVRLWR